MTEANDASWRRLREAFRVASRLEGAARRAWIDEVSRDNEDFKVRLERMLAVEEQAPEFLEQPLVEESGLFLTAPAEQMVGERLGPYRLERIIGRGGMGTVFEATQSHPRRAVAMKVLNAGIISESALRRFEHESQILARLRHPGIAQIYDAGTHAFPGGVRLPYFAMEYVPEARSLTEYASASVLSTRQRLELLAGVCDAVHHGHQKGIIHRDLKPDNILVDFAGQTKIIDFGIARVTDPEAGLTTMTEHGQLIGTLKYMSPEQLAGNLHDVDTRSDVYSLGVLLFELLCGRLPYDVAHDAPYEAVLHARAQPVTQPDSIDRRLKGDVQTIVLKALEKERDRRYRSAAELGDDLRRYLNNEPITARPQSVAYQLRMLAGRNRGVTGAISGALLLLVVGAFGITWQAAEAQREARTATQASEFLVGMFENPDRNRADNVMAREILDNGARRLERELVGQPRLRAQLLTTMGVAYRELGLFDEAQPLLEDALALAEQTFGEDDERVGVALYQLASVLKLEPTRARAMYERSVSILERSLGRDDPRLVPPLNRLAAILYEDEELEAVRAILKRTLKILDRSGERISHSSVVTLIKLGKVEATLGNYGRARGLFDRALETAHQAHGPDHRSVASAMDNLADLLQSRGELERARGLHLDALAIRERTYLPEHPHIGGSLFGLGINAMLRGDVAQAGDYLERAAAVWEAAYGPDHPRFTEALGPLARVRTRLGDYASARELLQRALDVTAATRGTEHVLYAQHLGNLARLLEATGDLEGAYARYEEALRIREPGPPTLELAEARFDFARLLEQSGQTDRARELFEAALRIRERWLPPGHPDLTGSQQACAHALRRMGRFGEAERLEARAGIVPTVATASTGR